MKLSKEQRLSYVYAPHLAPAPSNSDAMYRDPECRGLFIRVTKAGSRAWYLYTTINNRPLKMKIANCDEMSYQEARIETISLLRDLRLKGINPRMRKLSLIRTSVETLFKKYFDEHVQPHNSRPSATAAGFELYWSPIRNKFVEHLLTADVQTWVNQLGRTKGKSTANKQLAILKACINWGMRQGLLQITRNPCSGVTNFKTMQREKHLDKGERYRKLKEAINDNPGDAADIIEIALFTGARKSNILSMRWEDIYWDARVWRIPKDKRGRYHPVALVPEAMAILSRRHKSSAGHSQWVFPSLDSKTGHIVDFHRQWYKIREAGGLDPDFHFHDLRHTTGTWLADSGASAFTIGKVLGHSNIRTSQRYVHMALEPARDLLEKVMNDAAGKDNPESK